MVIIDFCCFYMFWLLNADFVYAYHISLMGTQGRMWLVDVTRAWLALWV